MLPRALRLREARKPVHCYTASKQRDHASPRPFESRSHFLYVILYSGLFPCEACIKTGEYCFHHRTSLEAIVGDAVGGARLFVLFLVLILGGRREMTGIRLPGSLADRPAHGHRWVGR